MSDRQICSTIIIFVCMYVCMYVFVCVCSIIIFKILNDISSEHDIGYEIPLSLESLASYGLHKSGHMWIQAVLPQGLTYQEKRNRELALENWPIHDSIDCQGRDILN